MTDHARIPPPPAPCPICNYQGEQEISQENSTDVPEPGDVTVCLKCGAVLQYDDDLVRHALTRKQIQALPGYMRDWLAKVETARLLVAQRQGAKLTTAMRAEDEA